MLYAEQTIDDKRVVTPIVLSEGEIVIPETGDSRKKSSMVQPARNFIGGVPIHLLYEEERAIELVNARKPIVVPIDNIANFLRDGSVMRDNEIFKTSLPPDAKIRLASGLPLTVIGLVKNMDGKERRALIRFVPSILEMEISQEEMDHLLVSGKLSVGDKSMNTQLSSNGIKTLFAGEEVLVTANSNDEKIELIRIRVKKQEARPFASQYQISDLAEFIASPSIPGDDFRPLPVKLTAEC